MLSEFVGGVIFFILLFFAMYLLLGAPEQIIVPV